MPINTGTPHDKLCNTLARIISNTGQEVFRECRLPNNRIADVLARSASGLIEIFEVKTELKSSMIASAWRKYRAWSNRLSIVYLAEEPFRIVEFARGLSAYKDFVDVGIYYSDGDHLACHRIAGLRTLNAPLRRQLHEGLTRAKTVGGTGSLLTLVNSLGPK